MAGLLCAARSPRYKNATSVKGSVTSAHGDRKRFADDYIPTIRSWNESIFAGALDDSRSPKDKKDLIESFYGTYHERVLEEPEGHGMDYVHAYMSIRKI